MDALGSAIRVDSRGREVMRILPRINDARERGVDFRQDAPDRRRSEDAAPRPPLYARERPAASGLLAGGVRRHRRQGEGDVARRSIGALVGDLAAVEEMFALKLLMRAAWLAESRLPPGRREARSEIRPRLLSLQRDDRGHRGGRRAAHHRRQSAQGSAGSQRAHPQALAAGRLQDRRSSASAPTSPTTTTISAPARNRCCEFIQLPAKPARRSCWSSSGRALCRAPTARRRSRSPLRPRRSSAVVGDGWNGFSVLHTAAARVGALDLGFTPGAGRSGCARDGEGRRARSHLQPRRRRNRHRARRLRGLHRHAWRSRRASRRRDPAGRRLYGKIRRSTSTRKAACSAPSRVVFPPGDAREDWAILRALSGALGTAAALRLACGSCARLLVEAHPHFARTRPDRAGRCRAGRRARQASGRRR